MFIPGEEVESRKRPSTFEVTVGVVVPVGIAAVAAARTAGAEFWGLIGLGFFVSGTVLYKPLTAVLRHQNLVRKDRAWVAHNLAEFKKLVDQFDRMTEYDKSDTLHYIVRSEVYRNNANAIERLHLLPHDVVTDSLHHLKVRVAALNANVGVYVQAMDEFETIVRHYIRYYVEPVYAKLPANPDVTVEQRIRGELEAFRERFNIFQDRLDQLQRAASTDLQTVNLRSPYFPRVKPFGMH